MLSSVYRCYKILVARTDHDHDEISYERHIHEFKDSDERFVQCRNRQMNQWRSKLDDEM